MNREGVTKERLALAARVRELREQGMTYRQLAAELGISYSYAHQLVYDPDGEDAKARKESYRGVCGNCGAPTTGSYGRKRKSKYCQTCAPKMVKASGARLVWTRERLIEAIRWWAEEFGEPPSMTDWNPYHTGQRPTGLGRAEQSKRLQAEGRIPWFNTVVRMFGSWNKAIEAAGFTPREPYGTSANLQRAHPITGETRKGRRWKTR